MSLKSLNFIDLFSGCGGFSTGLEMAGHRCLLGVDFDQDAINSFAHNHFLAQTFCGDIKKLDKTKLNSLLKNQRVDMIVGGPPCQGFSTVGKGEVSDDRNQLFKQFVRIVSILKPKVIILENVTGMLAKKNRFILKNIFKQFESLGYQMQAKVLSADEFGVPSRRRRTFIVGTVRGEFHFPTAICVESNHKSTVRDAFNHLMALDGEVYNHDLSASKIKNELDFKRLKYIPPGMGIRYQSDELKYLPKRLRYNIDWSTLREGRFRQTRLQRLALDAPAPTILTSKSMYYHPSEPRYLTAREAAACQSFPNEFEFLGTQTAIFRQIGNAVPPLLAMQLGLAVAQINWKKQKLSKHSLDFGFYKKAFNYQREA
jgi:DNA (cytosine-5)-methyltransferase 1